MANLVRWYRNVVDPGMTASDTIEESERVQNHIAEFSQPPSASDVFGQRDCPQFFSFLIDENGRVDNRFILIGRELQTIPDAPQAVRVRCQYSSKWINEQNKDTPNVQFQWIQNPLQRPALTEWGTYVVREVVEQATLCDGANLPSNDKTVPIATTAGEPILIEEEYHRRMLTITKNVAKVDKIFAENSDYINEEDTIIGGHKFSKLTLWLADLSIGNISVENGVLYYPVIMRIFHNPKTWIRRVRNAGYYMKDFNNIWVTDANGVKKRVFPVKPIILSDGTRTNQPILLDDDGRPLQAKITMKIPRPDNLGNVGPDDYEYQYEIIAPDDFGRSFTQDELKSTVRHYLTRTPLNFTKKLPLF